MALSDSIPIDAIKKYLEMTGWSLHAEESERSLVFYSPEAEHGGSLEVVLPKSRTSDYHRRLDEVLEALAQVEDKPASDITYSILNPEVDVLRLQITGQEAFSLPMALATNVVNGLRDVFYQGACYVWSDRIYNVQSSPIANHFVHDQCRFGQTYQGSFGFTIEVGLQKDKIHHVSSKAKSEQELIEADALNDEPVTAAQSTVIVKPATPFPRQVTERVFRGLLSAEAAQEANSSEPILAKAEQGLNANMCVALSQMFGVVDKNRFDFNLAWSPTVPAMHASVAKKVIKLDNRVKKFLNESAAQMKKEPPLDEFVTLKGEVIELKLETEQDGDQIKRERRIVMQCEDNKDILKKTDTKVRVFLAPEVYAIACDAHKGSRIIQLSGQLQKVRNMFYLINPQSLKVLP